MKLALMLCRGETLQVQHAKTGQKVTQNDGRWALGGGKLLHCLSELKRDSHLVGKKRHLPCHSSAS